MSFTTVFIKLAVVALAATGVPTPTVSATPAPNTPYLVSDGTATPVALMTRQCGSLMWTVGSFTTVGAPNRTPVTRTNVMAYDMVTGALAPVAPAVNGQVDTIAFTPDCASAYLGGIFTSVGGVAVKDIAKISTTTGALDPTFGHKASDEVSALVLANGHLFAGGRFKTINGSTGTTATFFTSLDPTTGQLDGYANSLGITGTLGTLWGVTDKPHVFKMWLDPAGDRLAVNGVFSTVLGQHRDQVFILDLGSGSVSLDGWYAPILDIICVYPFSARGIAWSPDGQFLYIVATGSMVVPGLCDSVAKFSSAPSPWQVPLWQNLTGSDSLYSVAATDTDVYVAGHMRWMDNPTFNDCGPGCVSRPGIADVDATTGLATDWNPTRSRGHGAQDLFLDTLGDLWVSADAPAGSSCGKAYHPGICEFPHS